MTLEEAIKMLTAKAECMRRETSGIDIDCNYRNCDECDLCYAQGTTGEQREALGMAIKALEKQIPKELIAEGDGYADGSMVYDSFYCPSCDHRMEEDEVEDYCPNCGQKICWEEE